MESYTQKPILALWEIVKPISNIIKVFKEQMHEDEDSIPESYLLLIADLSNSISRFGDGESLTRDSDCNILLVSKGNADSSKDVHNINKEIVENRLKAAGIPYKSFNLGYDNVLKSTQHSYAVTVRYYG